MRSVKRGPFTSYYMMTEVGRRSCRFQHVSNTVNQNSRGTNKGYKIYPVCTTLQFPEPHNYCN